MRPNLSTFGDELEKLAISPLIEETVRRMWATPRTGPSGQLVANQLRGPRLRRGAPTIAPMQPIPEQVLVQELQQGIGGFV